MYVGQSGKNDGGRERFPEGSDIGLHIGPSSSRRCVDELTPTGTLVSERFSGFTSRCTTFDLEGFLADDDER